MGALLPTPTRSITLWQALLECVSDWVRWLTGYPEPMVSDVDYQDGRDGGPLEGVLDLEQRLPVPEHTRGLQFGRDIVVAETMTAGTMAYPRRPLQFGRDIVVAETGRST